MSATRGEAWIYPKGSGIRIRQISNLTGPERKEFGVSFQVTVPARLTGKDRMRKQFDKRKDAEDFAEEQLAGTKTLGEQFFEVLPMERRAAVAALDLLRPRKISELSGAVSLDKLSETERKKQASEFIREIVDAALKAINALPENISLLQAVQYASPRMKPAGGDRTIDDVVEEMVHSKELRRDNGQLRERSLRDFRSRARIFSGHFGEKLINSITAAEIKEWLVGLKLSARTNKNHLNTIAEILRYALQKKYVGVDPLADLTDDDRKELVGHEGENQEPHILTMKQTEKLLLTALNNPKLDLLAYATLALFCGIRSAELLKLRWEHITDKYVIVPASIAKKRRVRHVDLPANAKSWLALCQRRTGPIVDASYAAFGRRFFNFRTLAGFETWAENYMRHSFGTYHFALHGNALETARQMGHSQGDDSLFTHYRALAKKEDGEAFFTIMPPAPAANIVQLSIAKG